MITILRFYTEGLGQNFLTIRRWEPKFYATTTVCSQTAIWARLPGLPAEYYDPVLLKKMGEKLGTVLKIDAHTNDALRGQYACICVQVNINQPLKTSVHISYLWGIEYDLFYKSQTWTQEPSLSCTTPKLISKSPCRVTCFLISAIPRFPNLTLP